MKEPIGAEVAGRALAALGTVALIAGLAGLPLLLNGCEGQPGAQLEPTGAPDLREKTSENVPPWLARWRDWENERRRLVVAGTDEAGVLWYFLAPPHPRTEPRQVSLGSEQDDMQLEIRQVSLDSQAVVRVRTLAELVEGAVKLPHLESLGLELPFTFTTDHFTLRALDQEETVTLRRMVRQVDRPIQVEACWRVYTH